jgi:hypothetical protein
MVKAGLDIYLSLSLFFPVIPDALFVLA